jgi:hypothetical protein
MEKTNKYLLGCALVGAAAFLYLQLFIFPDVPKLPSGDQTIWLLNGRRMLEGQVIYRDFFEYVFPGTQTIWCALFYLFGVRAWVVDATLISLGLGFAWTSVLISGKLFAGASIILPGFLFLAIPFRNAPMECGTHHWYSSLGVMAGLAVLIGKRSPRRLLVAGALCGVSAWFNQTRGPAGLLGFAVFLLWERLQTKEAWRLLLGREARLFGSFVTTLVGLTAYYVWKGGLQRFLFCTVVFLMKYFPSAPGAGWNLYWADMPSFRNWYKSPLPGEWLVIELLVPWVYFMFFWRARRERAKRPQEPWDRLMLVSIVGLCLFLSVAPSAMNYRLCTVSLPALILLVWFARWPGKIKRVTLPLLSVGLLALMMAETRSIQTGWGGTLDLPVGRVATLSRDEAEEFRWFLSHVTPSDFLFGDQKTNFDLGLQNPTPIDFVTASDFTRPEQVRGVVHALETKRVRWVEWMPDTNFQEGPGNHLGPLCAYLHAHYHAVKTPFDSDERILERNGQ